MLRFHYFLRLLRNSRVIAYNIKRILLNDFGSLFIHDLINFIPELFPEWWLHLRYFGQKPYRFYWFRSQLWKLSLPMELQVLLRVCLLQYWLRPFLLWRRQHYLLWINSWYRRNIGLNQARVNIRRAYPQLMVSLPRHGFIIPVLIGLFNYGLHPLPYTGYDRTP